MKKLLTGYILLLILTACSDDPEDDNKYEQMTKADWIMSEWYITYKINNVESKIDVYADPRWAYKDPCILDDELTFYDNHKYQTQPGNVQCDPVETPSLFLNGEWQIFGDTLSIEPYDAINAWNHKLNELSDTLLSFSRIISLGDGNGNYIDATETYNYKHR